MSFHDLSSRTDFPFPPKPKRVPRISSQVGVLLLACNLPAQKIHVVDASGNTGQYKTITATSIWRVTATRSSSRKACMPSSSC
jgi:hypothetical protein